MPTGILNVWKIVQKKTFPIQCNCAINSCTKSRNIRTLSTPFPGPSQCIKVMNVKKKKSQITGLSFILRFSLSLYKY